MKTRMIALALFAATASVALAQDATTPATSAKTATPATTESYHDKMVRELELTADQAEKLEAIELRHRESAKELNRANLDTKARNEKARELRERKDAELKAMLTPAQYEKLIGMRKQKHDATLQRQEEMKKTHQE